MKVVAKNIDMIAYFKNDGMINPISFKLKEENKQSTIKIEKIINRSIEKLCGNKMYIFTCSTKIGHSEKIFEIKYDIDKCRWILFRI